MEIVRGHSALGRRLDRPVIAIGNFDGVHRGHAFIFDEVRRMAAPGAEAVVLTFEPHPAKVLAPQFAPPLITPLQRKLELIAEHGIDVTVVQPFDQAFAALSPVEFVDRVLDRGLGAQHVCVGANFTFGRARAGTIPVLGELARERGFELHVIPDVTVDGMMCSSTKVREFVLEGRIDGARLVLGRDPEVEGEVVRGDGRGKSIGVPTANLKPDTELLPKEGVYAGWAERIGEPRKWPAAINIGNNPTFGGAKVTVEAHLLDADVELYGARLRLGFVERLRGEQRFPSVDELVAQIRRDVEKTRAVMRNR
ncbi:MAG TPA: bifunctional riboflavin kinase/FAD synthetase [Polyangia bacterium]|nr:bifunctional riboflavin kinase/FAD synthetase [Polyangia bacterium]